MSKLEVDNYDLTYRIKDFTVHCKFCDSANTELTVESRHEDYAECYIWCLDCKESEQLIE